jgi:hypothetical protein
LEKKADYQAGNSGIQYKGRDIDPIRGILVEFGYSPYDMSLEINKLRQELDILRKQFEKLLDEMERC